MKAKLGAAHLMLTAGQGGMAVPTTPGAGSSAQMPTPNALAAFFNTTVSE